MKDKNIMETKEIEYFKNMKYVLSEDVWVFTEFRGHSGRTSFIELFESGWLHIKKGWGWDGASGFTIDTKNSMRGSLAHDGGALCIRHGFIPQEDWSKNDEMLERINMEDGMCSFRAKLWTKVLRMVGGAYGSADKKRTVYTAP